MKRKKILFVCTGNTCRSPMAEAVLRSYIKKRKIKWWDVASCGIQAEIGGSMSPNSVSALKDMGIAPSETFKPRQLTQRLIESSTLVITMTRSQKQMLEECGNVVCIDDFCGTSVPDPYGKGLEVYKSTCAVIAVACRNIIENFILKYEDNNI